MKGRGISLPGRLLGQKSKMLSKVENRGPRDDGWWRSCSFMRKLLRFAGGGCRDARGGRAVKGRAWKKSGECRAGSLSLSRWHAVFETPLEKRSSIKRIGVIG